ncbi:enoyl-CoA hydratase/isomerase family protein [Microbacterium sp. USTB-Y]|uniref:enoyl-CoA hydratase/isomerase family protein n=1 Tax=Microbacterium sp. USTB-Y TaxID=2823692 RepID=UPI0020419BF8|nr:enoyl-CoA hydratase/isomerase family protein [Microbacterium sp. USTB-Y]
MGTKRWDGETVDSWVDEHGIGTVMLNRPEKLNAFNPKMTEEFRFHMERFRSDDAVKAVIIGGKGRAFCAGHDVGTGGGVTGLTADGKSSDPPQRQRLRESFDVVGERTNYILLFPKVTIAMVHGYCIGAGTGIAMACDLTVVADNAVISWEANRHGRATGSDLWVMLHLGPKKARELALTGGRIAGSEAEALGWASRSVPEEDLMAETMRLARQVVLQPRDGLALGKAVRQLEFERLGIANRAAFALENTLFTNIRFEDDEPSFFRDRQDFGPREAMHRLKQRYDDARNAQPADLDE